MKNRIPNFCGSRLKFVMQGSNSSGERGRLLKFFLKVRIAKMRVLGWLVDAFRAVKLALKHSCEKHPYVCSLSSVARLWVRL